MSKEKDSTWKKIGMWVGGGVILVATVAVGVAYVAAAENEAFLDGVEAHADHCG